MLKEEFDYRLSESSHVEYQQDGKFVKAEFITLKAPSKKHRRLIMKLYQYFCRAREESILKLKQQNVEFNDDEIPKEKIDEKDSLILGSSAVKATLCCSTIDINEIIDVFEELLLQIGYINNLEILRQDTIKGISIEDTLEMLGEYIINFTIIF